MIRQKPIDILYWKSKILYIRWLIDWVRAWCCVVRFWICMVRAWCCIVRAWCFAYIYWLHLQYMQKVLVVRAWCCVVRFWICVVVQHVVLCVAMATNGRFCMLGTSFASTRKAFVRLGCVIINSEWCKLCQTSCLNMNTSRITVEEISRFVNGDQNFFNATRFC